MELLRFFQSAGWTVEHETSIPARDPLYVGVDKLELSHPTQKLLEPYADGIYVHQARAIREYLDGSNVCLATTTASGKTLAFQTCGVERLARSPQARILAIYPLKALGTEQEERWRAALIQAGLSASVARLDGGVKGQEARLKVLRSRVVVATPDILHAWLLGNLGAQAVRAFMRNVELIVVDEAHTYSGVFGSNAAYLFRRLNHLIRKLGGSPTYIAASATMRDPEHHLAKLTGESFRVVGAESESSPKAGSSICLVSMPDDTDFLTGCSELMKYVAQNTEHRFITFVDSRKQTEYLAAIGARENASPTLSEDGEEPDFASLEAMQVLPYRSGYEEEDRRQIQDRLTRALVRGVVSTSALEMGIDIPHLDLAILAGVPRSATSFYQRIGRVGRREPGNIVIINNRTILTESVFRQPERLMNLPLTESALYLDNHRIQYIHALCLARDGGEDALVVGAREGDASTLEPQSDFPQEFLALCAKERLGEIGPEFQTMKAQAGDDPNHTFPLRDVDAQYQVEWHSGPARQNLGSLSHGQLMREAYPGAVYYYRANPFRVYRVNLSKRLVEVRREKRYITTPSQLPTLIFPNLSEGNLHQSVQWGDLKALECNLQVREALSGFRERRGQTERLEQYPLNPSIGTFDGPRFTRNYFTSGVLLGHPALQAVGVDLGLLSELLFEAFLITIPFERQDIQFGWDRHRATREGVQEGERFLAIYDQTYGSLRLTSRVLDFTVLREVIERALDIGQNERAHEITPPTLAALAAMAKALHENEPLKRTGGGEVPCRIGDGVRVIVPGCVGLNAYRDNEEFTVDDVIYSPALNGPAYRGRYLTQQSARFASTVTVVAVDHLTPIPGESRMGCFDPETGVLTPDQ